MSTERPIWAPGPRLVAVIVAAVSAVAACGGFTPLAAARSARATPTVEACLKRAGLNDVTQTEPDRWQGVVGRQSRSDEVASVFVLGPYSSRKAVREAARTAGPGEIGGYGGFYLLVGNAAGHTAKPIAISAACLRLIPTDTPPKHSPPLKF